MPGLMVTAIVFLAITVLALVVTIVAGRKYKTNDDEDTRLVRNTGRGVAIIGVVLVGGFVLLSSWTQVPTKEIGVITTFGHPDGELSNGLHFINPLSTVTTLDGARQNDQRLSPTTCTTVRLGNQSTACVENAVQWQIDPAAADELYMNYRDFDKIRSKLVDNNLAVELNTAFSTYDPLASLANQTSQGGNPSTALTTDELNILAGKVHTGLQHDVGSAITIQNVSITVVHYDQSTEDKINQYQAAAANTRIAKQNEQTAAAQSAANQVLSQSVNNNTNVLVSKCLDTLNEMVQKNTPVPAGFSCWPGGNAGVLVGAGAPAK